MKYKDIIKIKLNLNALPQTKDETYVINLYEYKSIGTHWIALYVNDNNVTSLDGFGVEHIPKEIKKFIGNNIVKAKSFYKFIFTKQFLKNDGITLKYFQLCIN